MKLLFALPIAILCFWLWWPQYDLEVALKPGPSDYAIVERDFYTIDGCREASRRWKSYDWVCLEKSGWGRLFNKYSSYNAKVR